MPTFFTMRTREATGMPMVSAVSRPEPVEMVNAVPRTVPEIISGGMLAPMENEPMKASSRVAPSVTPVGMSPMMMPVSAPITSGRDRQLVPSRYSALPSMATRPSRMAWTIICAPFCISQEAAPRHPFVHKQARCLRRRHPPPMLRWAPHVWFSGTSRGHAPRLRTARACWLAEPGRHRGGYPTGRAPP